MSFTGVKKVYNPRQQKLLQRILEKWAFSDGISRKKYKNLVHTTDITATRDLRDLVEKNVMQTLGAGRNVAYFLCIPSLDVRPANLRKPSAR